MEKDQKEQSDIKEDEKFDVELVIRLLESMLKQYN